MAILRLELVPSSSMMLEVYILISIFFKICTCLLFYDLLQTNRVIEPNNVSQACDELGIMLIWQLQSPLKG